MAHICRIMVAHFEGDPLAARYDERGSELWDDYNLEGAITYCEDLLAAGENVCPSQGWDLERMRVWASARLAEHRELLVEVKDIADDPEGFAQALRQQYGSTE